MRRHLLRAAIVGILGACAVFAFHRSSDAPYTLTIAGAKPGNERRIDLRVGLGNNLNEDSVLLTLTNHRGTPLKYNYHSTGPDVKWEFNFKGVLYELPTYGRGSGFRIDKVLETGQSSVIPRTLGFGSLPEAMREAIYASDGWDGLFIKIKMRATVVVYGTGEGSVDGALSFTSDWESFYIGIPHES